MKKLLFIHLLLLSSCASILEGPKQKIVVHCEPSEDLQVVANGAEVNFSNGIILLDKKRETNFVTFSKVGYYSTTIAFDTQINPVWPIADIIWLPAAPIAWFVDWYTGAIKKVVPKDIHVVLRKREGGGQ